MQFKHTDGQGTEANVDLTPLIDVVFILLIFFILSASFQKTQSLELERPTAQVQDNQDKRAILISIDKHNVIWLEQQAVKAVELPARLKHTLASSEQSSAIIEVDKHVTSGKLIEVVDKVRIAGVNNVAVATQDPS
ncbi:ExbD/TolR family protein [Shewanella algae]|uniref:Biopolymer transport protein ExbD n=2 Tax=Bacteria TaxID=2 RepID=A0A379ZWM6_9GAMM|nr:biopolymer transporter ExbD [Shewanella algae]MBO2609426.1 biopolymer transporter ExbD [Shewanella algae]MBO2613749.1 biopolymer transporter ExbD [Shewanella algae]MBO2638860.1 biopolymer transporter ExbD [Shewanella algae]MBO2651397.1 biopolymer transporter ExbD [Shewanella algae]MCT8979931.1 biopolymer transporter ExbD [Shewanella algae]